MKNVKMWMIFMFIFLMSTNAFAQASHTIDFEAANGGNWNWIVQDNDTNPAMVIADDPTTGGKPNNCGHFNALQTGQTYASVYTTDDGEFTFDASNSTVTVDVNKPVSSMVVVKFEGTSMPVEVYQTNTTVNGWQTLTFDFSAYEGNTYNKLIIMPDVASRTQDNMCYIDNIVVPDGVVSSGPTPAPTPTNDPSDVISIYSDAFTDITGVNLNPFWNQNTVFSEVQLSGNNTILYESLDYQGTDWSGNPQNVSAMEYLHVDFWTNNIEDLGIYMISTGPVEYEYVFTISSGVWNSVDIPLTYFSGGGVDLTDAIQFKIESADGGGTPPGTPGDVYFDNMYFWRTATAPGEDTRLSDLQIDGQTVWGFEANIRSYDYEVPVGYSGVPVVTCTLNDPAASYQIFDTGSVPGITQVEVTASNGTTVDSYYVNFTSQGYTLIWSDEFDQALSQPDPANWVYDTGYGPNGEGWGNWEWQLYTNSTDNVKLQNGELVISAQCPSGTPGERDGSITSGRIKTLGQFDARYGLFQARVKAPTGNGAWAAFWTMGANFPSVGWPYCGEIDIMEVAPLHVGNNSTNLSAIHWYEDTATAHWYSSYTKDIGVDLSNDYHIYEIDWEYDRVIGKIDGMPYWEKEINWIGMKEFLDEFFILFNVAIGGTLGGSPDGTTTWPQEMFVDWVRVYQLNNPTSPITQAPIPTQDPADVISIYGHHYGHLPGADFNVWWDVAQTTFVIQDYPIADGDSLNYYDNLNFQGTDFNSNKQDVSGMDYLHLDYWPHSSNTLLDFYVAGGTWGVDFAEFAYSLPVTNGQWNSIDIPLSHFAAGGVDLTDVGQFKVEGDGNVWFDNMYFWDDFYDPLTDATLSDLKVDGTTIDGFVSVLYNYEYDLPNGTVTVPTVTATTNNAAATHQVLDAASLPGTTEVAVTAENGTTTQSYFVDFVFQPVAQPPVPTHDPADVISVYSDAYTNISPVNYNPLWMQTTVVTYNYVIGTDSVLYYDKFDYQGTDWSTIPQDVSTYDYLHVDYWANSKVDSLGVFLVSSDFKEQKYDFTVTPHQWNSVEVPLTAFQDSVNFTEVIQFKFEGSGDVWLDNLYFYKSAALGVPVNVVTSISGSDLTISWDPVAGAASYVVYSSDDPYGSFTIDTNGSFSGESWTVPVTAAKMFYYITSSDAAKTKTVK